MESASQTVTLKSIACPEGVSAIQVGVFAECPLHYGLKIALHNKIFLPKHTLFENK